MPERKEMTDKELLEKLALLRYSESGYFREQEAQYWLKAIRTIPPEEICEVKQCAFYLLTLTKSLNNYHELQWKKLL